MKNVIIWQVKTNANKKVQCSRREKNNSSLQQSLATQIHCTKSFDFHCKKWCMEYWSDLVNQLHPVYEHEGFLFIFNLKENKQNITMLIVINSHKLNGSPVALKEQTA